MAEELLIAAHTVEVAVETAFAWAFWTNVSNWDDPPASFTLHGPFAAGTTGTTVLPGAEPLAWTIRDAHERSATIEMTLDDALIRFAWTFATVGPAHTAITQRITLSGYNRAAYVAAARAGLSSIDAGMARLAEGMLRARSQPPQIGEN